MKLKEYMEKYRKSSLTRNERIAFSVPDLKKGWKKRYGDLEALDSVAQILIDTIESSKKRSKSQRKKERQKLDFAVAYEKTNDQLLYLMENVNGLLKIGISVDPIKRARAITTGSGIQVHLVAVWKLDKNARKVEGQLHKSFSRFRLEGEWFSPGTVTAEDIERNISCNWENLLLNQSLEERKLEDKPVDIYTYSEVRFETVKAILFVINGEEQWCPKSRIYHMNRGTKEIKVAKGQFTQPS